jgi:probable F420-dependent oxidoreductase
MDIGVTIHATDLTIEVPELAVAAEERGFTSLYVPEHTHIPVSRETPPPTGGDELEEKYRRTPDPIVSLAAAASVTSTIRLGTAVALPAQHDPISWAKAVATLDRLAGGRVTLGVGYGWNVEEMRDHGVEYGTRRALVREHMLLAQSIWRDDVAAFAGERTSLPPSWSWPKPVQQPRVRTLVGGGAGPKLFAAVAEWADGWIPFGGSGLKAHLPALREAVAEAGRDPEELHIVPMGVLPSREKLEFFESLGVTETALQLPVGTRDEVLVALDEFATYL